MSTVVAVIVVGAVIASRIGWFREERRKFGNEEDTMREQFREIATNLTPVRVVGIPGLTLVLIAIALAMQFPEARWLIAAGVSGGAVIAAVLVRRRRDERPGGGGPLLSLSGSRHRLLHDGDRDGRGELLRVVDDVVRDDAGRFVVVVPAGV
jgi:hypothetical protein